STQARQDCKPATTDALPRALYMISSRAESRRCSLGYRDNFFAGCHHLKFGAAVDVPEAAGRNQRHARGCSVRQESKRIEKRTLQSRSLRSMPGSSFLRPAWTRRKATSGSETVRPRGSGLWLLPHKPSPWRKKQSF